MNATLCLALVLCLATATLAMPGAIGGSHEGRGSHDDDHHGPGGSHGSNSDEHDDDHGDDCLALLDNDHRRGEDHTWRKYLESLLFSCQTPQCTATSGPVCKVVVSDLFGRGHTVEFGFCPCQGQCTESTPSYCGSNLLFSDVARKLCLLDNPFHKIKSCARITIYTCKCPPTPKPTTPKPTTPKPTTPKPTTPKPTTTTTKGLDIKPITSTTSTATSTTTTTAPTTTTTESTTTSTATPTTTTESTTTSTTTESTTTPTTTTSTTTESTTTPTTTTSTTTESTTTSTTTESTTTPTTTTPSPPPPQPEVTYEPPVNDPCESWPCENGGACVSSVNGVDYTCECLDGFEGINCELTTTTTTTTTTKPTTTTTKPTTTPPPSRG